LACTAPSTSSASPRAFIARSLAWRAPASDDRHAASVLAARWSTACLRLAAVVRLADRFAAASRAARWRATRSASSNCRSRSASAASIVSRSASSSARRASARASASTWTSAGGGRCSLPPAWGTGTVFTYHGFFEPIRAQAMTWVNFGGRRSAVYPSWVTP